MLAAVEAARGVHGKIIVVGGGLEASTEEKKLRKIRRMRDFLVDHGITSDQIVGVLSHPDTLGNLRALYRVCGDMFEDQTVGILTNDYHMPRVTRMLADPQFVWKAEFVPLVAEAYHAEVTERRDSLDAFLRRRIAEEQGLKDWENAAYTAQFLAPDEWNGEAALFDKLIA